VADWLEEMLADREAAKRQKSLECEQELLRQQELKALAPNIWGQILKSVESVNRRLSLGRIISPFAGRFSLAFHDSANPYVSLVIRLDADAGVLTCTRPGFPRDDRAFPVKVDSEARWNIEDEQGNRIPFERIDEVLLKDFIASLLEVKP